jgi:hypothetical protein
MGAFNTLSSIDVSAKTEKKGNLTYLSWAWAWAEACKVLNVKRKVYENDRGWNYHTDGETGWVKVGVIIDEIEHIDYLPIMDNRNKSFPVDKITSMEVNKAIQRSTTKALALHGLGLNVYAGEDLPITPPSKEELTPDHASWQNGVENVVKGWTIENVRQYFKITDKNFILLKEQAGIN